MISNVCVLKLLILDFNHTNGCVAYQRQTIIFQRNEYPDYYEDTNSTNAALAQLGANRNTVRRKTTSRRKRPTKISIKRNRNN